MVSTQSWWSDNYPVGGCLCYGAAYLLIVILSSVVYFVQNVDKYFKVGDHVDESKLTRLKGQVWAFLDNMWDRIELYLIIVLHVIDQSSDFGALLQYWKQRNIILSADVTQDTRVLILFWCSLITIIFYRLVSSVAVWHLTKNICKTMTQFLDVELIVTLELNWKLVRKHLTYPGHYILFFTILQSIPNALFSLVYIVYTANISKLPTIITVSFCMNIICALLHIIIADTKIFKKNSQTLGLICVEWIKFKGKQMKQLRASRGRSRGASLGSSRESTRLVIGNTTSTSKRKSINSSNSSNSNNNSNNSNSSVTGNSNQVQTKPKSNDEKKDDNNSGDDDDDNNDSNDAVVVVIDSKQETRSMKNISLKLLNQNSGYNIKHHIVAATDDDDDDESMSALDNMLVVEETNNRNNDNKNNDNNNSSDKVDGASNEADNMDENDKNDTEQEEEKVPLRKDGEDQVSGPSVATNNTNNTGIKKQSPPLTNPNKNKMLRTRTPNFSMSSGRKKSVYDKKKEGKKKDKPSAIKSKSKSTNDVIGVVDELQRLGPQMQKSSVAIMDDNESVDTDPSWDEKDREREKEKQRLIEKENKSSIENAISPLDNIEDLLDASNVKLFGKNKEQARRMPSKNSGDQQRLTTISDSSLATDATSETNKNKSVSVTSTIVTSTSTSTSAARTSISNTLNDGINININNSAPETTMLKTRNTTETTPYGQFLKRQNTIERILSVPTNETRLKQQICFNPGFVVRVGLRVIEITTRIGALSLLWLLFGNWWSLPLCIGVDVVVCGIAAINNRQIDFLLFVFYFAIIGGNTRSKHEIDKFGNYYQFVAMFRFLYNYCIIIFLWTYNDEVNEISAFASLLLVYITMCGFVLPCAFATVLAKYAHREAKMVSSNQMDIFRMAKNGDKQAFEEVDAYGVKLNLKMIHPFYGCSVLHCAVSTLQYDMLKYFLNVKNLNANIVDEQMDTPLHYACRYSGPRSIYQVTKLLLTCEQTNVNAKNKVGNTALHLLCVFGARFDKFKNDEKAKQHTMSMITIAKELIGNGAMTDEFNQRNYTPLHLACVNCNYPMSMLLIKEYNVNVSLQTLDGNTTLHLLCLYLLRIRNSSSNKEERRKYIKKLNESMAIAFEILDKNLSVINKQNTMKKTALDLALTLDDQNWIRFLMVRGAITGKQIEFHNNLRKKLQREHKRRMKQKKNKFKYSLNTNSTSSPIPKRKHSKSNNYYYRPRSSIHDLVYGQSTKSLLETTFQDITRMSMSATPANYSGYGLNGLNGLNNFHGLHGMNSMSSMNGMTGFPLSVGGDRRTSIASIASRGSNPSPGVYDRNYQMFPGFPYVPSNNPHSKTRTNG